MILLLDPLESFAHQKSSTFGESILVHSSALNNARVNDVYGPAYRHRANATVLWPMIEPTSTPTD